jgi:AraC family transcriptional regulator, ethanolamine operon transcriptional activator
MTRMVFQDFDAFANALCGVSGRCVPTSRSTQEWWVHTISTGRARTQTLQIGSAATFAGVGKQNEVALHVPLTDPTKIRIDGQSLQHDSFLLIHEAQPFTLTTAEPTRWATIVVPSDQLLLSAEMMDLLRTQLFRTKSTSRTETAPEHLERIRFLAARLAAAIHNGTVDTVSARCAEEEIIVAASRALEVSRQVPSKRRGRPTCSRARVIASVLALMGDSRGAPLFVEDLCRAAGVSERTLRNVFQEYFGVGPMRLLKVRQLHEIRAALLAGDPKHDTVTCVATRFGMSDLSLFARNYKALFGEAPLQTLRSAPPPPQRPAAVQASWLDYASRAFLSDVAP